MEKMIGALGAAFVLQLFAMDAAAQDANLTINGRPPTAQDRAILARFEKLWGITISAGAYWYDNLSGAVGTWGGPTQGFLGPGLGLGGDLPAEASGGGRGKLTGVFINGREIHPQDFWALAQLLGQPPGLGRWWVDGAGNFGPEGYGTMGNLRVLAQRQGSSYYSSDIASGKSTFVGKGCAAVSGRLSPSDSNSSYSYYVGCE